MEVVYRYCCEIDMHKNLIMACLRKGGRQELDRMSEMYMAEFQTVIAEIFQMPGIVRLSAEVILAETGIDMSQFPSAAHLCSWAGVCPGNHQSTGKRYHGKTRKENKMLKSMLVQCTKAPSRVKGSYFSVQSLRIAARR